MARGNATTTGRGRHAARAMVVLGIAMALAPWLSPAAAMAEGAWPIGVDDAATAGIVGGDGQEGDAPDSPVDACPDGGDAMADGGGDDDAGAGADGEAWVLSPADDVCGTAASVDDAGNGDGEADGTMVSEGADGPADGRDGADWRGEGEGEGEGEGAEGVDAAAEGGEVPTEGDDGDSDGDADGEASLRAAAPQPTRFVDIDATVAHVDDVAWMAASGISEGWASGNGREFRPYASLARADMAAFAYRWAEGRGLVDDAWEPAGTPAFADVDDGTPHRREIGWLGEAGVAEGWEVDGSREFRPYASLARADMAAFLCRLARLAGIATDAAPGAGRFSDVRAGTPHAAEIAWLGESGISEGWASGDGREFRPCASLARSDMAAFMRRLDALVGRDEPTGRDAEGPEARSRAWLSGGMTYDEVRMWQALPPAERGRYPRSDEIDALAAEMAEALRDVSSRAYAHPMETGIYQLSLAAGAAGALSATPGSRQVATDGSMATVADRTSWYLSYDKRGLYTIVSMASDMAMSVTLRSGWPSAVTLVPIDADDASQKFVIEERDGGYALVPLLSKGYFAEDAAIGLARDPNLGGVAVAVAPGDAACALVSARDVRRAYDTPERLMAVIAEMVLRPAAGDLGKKTLASPSLEKYCFGYGTYEEMLADHDYRHQSLFTENIFGIAYSTATRGDGKVITRVFATLRKTTEEMRTCQMEIDAIVAPVVARARAVPQAEGARLIHDWLAGWCRAALGDDREDQNHAYGAIVNRSAMCGGYAEAYRYVCEKAGIECRYVSGWTTAEARDRGRYQNHAWNAVTIGGHTSYVDVGWDRMPEGAAPSDKYLMRSEAYMERNQHFLAEKYR